MISDLPRTKFPVLSPAFRALAQSQIPEWLDRLELDKSMKEMNRKRQANLCWRHFSFIYRKVLPPLPLKEFKMLEELSKGERIEKPVSSFRKQLLPMPISTNPHHITLRFRRRMYRKILFKCPKLVYNVDRGWIVEWSKEVPNKHMRTNSIHQDMFFIEEKKV